jgi:hypothetical protein
MAKLALFLNYITKDIVGEKSVPINYIKVENTHIYLLVIFKKKPSFYLALNLKMALKYSPQVCRMLKASVRQSLAISSLRFYLKVCFLFTFMALAGYPN